MDIGDKIKKIRKRNDLTQGEVADRSELTKGFISQVERNLTSPSIATLMDILDALGTNLNEFFSDDWDEQIVFTGNDSFESNDDKLRCRINWVIPNAQKNSMEALLVELESGGRTKSDIPHEGEEFGYVLSGSVFIVLDDKNYFAKTGDSFYYKAKTNHYIMNAGEEKAILIWVSSPPTF